jgi:hypothetical protein
MVQEEKQGRRRASGGGTWEVDGGRGEGPPFIAGRGNVGDDGVTGDPG